MAVTRIKNNQITDATITGSKFVNKTITGGLLSDNLTYGSNLTISGNLTVNGTTSTVDTTNTVIADPLLVLSRGETGTPSADSGFVIERGTSDNVGFIWDESADVFAAIVTTETGATAGNVTISSYANAKVGDIEATTASLGNIDISGNSIISTDTNGAITLTPNGTGDINLGADTVMVGDNNANATITTNGTGDLTLNTNSGTNSGSIVIADAANGNISLTPNGSGEVILSTAIISDLTDNRVLIAGTSGVVEDSANLTFDGTVLTTTKVTVDNISIDGDTISSAHTTITIDPATAGTGGTVVIAGNLQVTGTTTTVDSTVVTVADPVFQIGESGSDDNLDRGIKALYNNGGAKVAFFGMDDSNQEFIYISDATDSSSVFSGSLGSAAFGSLRVTDLTDNRVLIAGASGSVEDDGNLTYDGTDLSTNSLIVGDLTDNRVVIAGTSGAIEDSANLTFDGTVLTTTKITVDNISLDANSITSADNLTFDAVASGEIAINEAGADVNVRIEASGQANAVFVEGSSGNIGIKTATPNAGADIHVNSTNSIILPVGTTAQRPTAATGMLRFNTTTAVVEFYDGSGWTNAGSNFTVITADDFSGDGSTVAFTLSEDSTSAGLMVMLNGVVQDPGTAYSVSGTTLTFTEAPASGDNIDARIITTTQAVKEIADLNTSFAVNDTTETATTTINGNVVVTVTNAAVVPGANVTYDLGSSSLQWSTIYGQATSAQYADLAENYTADQHIEPGTVVCFGGDAEVTVCEHDADRRVAGVVSTNPAHLMNSGLEAEHVVALALQGRVPCKVVGPIAKGDMMVSAGNGAARAEAEPKMGSVIGKALENFDGEAGVIEVLVGRL